MFVLECCTKSKGWNRFNSMNWQPSFFIQLPLLFLRFWKVDSRGMAPDFIFAWFSTSSRNQSIVSWFLECRATQPTFERTWSCPILYCLEDLSTINFMIIIVTFALVHAITILDLQRGSGGLHTSLLGVYIMYVTLTDPSRTLTFHRLRISTLALYINFC